MKDQEITKYELSRRELICGALAAGLTVIGVGCQQTEAPPAGPGAAAPATSSTKAVANSAGTATVTGGGKLASGTALPIELPDGQPALLVSDKSGKLVALSALCTHSGCTVTWQDSDQKVICPCHGSIFDATGKVEHGPAKAPLPALKVQKKGDDAVLTL